MTTTFLGTSMAPPRLSRLAAVRRQDLLIEFSSLKYACPQGVFVSLTPGDPTLWSGVIFVRKGPYAPSILRFQISFPSTYPDLPPLVTFTTDIFHPLITPLTTYMHTTDVQDSGTGQSARDEERLPPGGFSLRAGFPAWFGRAARRLEEERNRGLNTPLRSVSGVASPTSTAGESVGSPTPGGTSGYPGQEKLGIFEVLRYMRSTFDDEDVLDSTPLEAAGNPGAWHAWRTHRIKTGALKTSWHDGLDEQDGSNSQQGSGKLAAAAAARRPGDWNWDGVWEVRSKKGIDGSVSEQMLFGRDAGDDLIRFLKLDGSQVDALKASLKVSVETVDPQRRAIT